jgi:hypothetical protein
MPTSQRINRTILIAGLLQIGSIYSPAARVRIYGLLPFLRIPSGGVALLSLGVLTLIVALRPNGWWRWIPAPLSAGVLALIYWRITHNPSATFVDPLLRHLMHPAWGFAPMSAAVLVGVVGAAMVRGPRSAEAAPLAIDRSLSVSSTT